MWYYDNELNPEYFHLMFKILCIENIYSVKKKKKKKFQLNI